MDRRGKRLGYRKSRNGCTRCKRRRVKCDELVPCTACVRHEEECSLELIQDSGDTAYASHSDVDVTWSHISPSGSSSLNPSLFLLEEETGSRECWITNAELNFHYANAASLSLYAFSEDAINTFQFAVPKEAISHPFLLRTIMAFSAYHLAYLTEDKRPYYKLLAANHQGHAVRGLRAALGNPITSDNCHAMYCASIFLTINKFAAFPNCGHHLENCCDPIQGLAEIFHLIYGMSAILQSSENNLRNGPLKTMFQLVGGPLAPLEDINFFYQQLSGLLAEVVASSLDEMTKQDLSGAIQALITCFLDNNDITVKKFQEEVRIIFSWPRLVPRRFPELIKASHPVALVVMAYYSYLIHLCSNKYWFLQGWPHLLKEQIATKLGDSYWGDVARWPLSVIENGSV